eukprot:CAMPEP_0202691112 /NCGR_PEP_ID=MMETSP1385-20130828/5917_1 /ASSEMBLY_ACC=CAM_ASM_000861 /TAXON_ID=933848 /ORGANISM="Elphidium margaritaceum" /LENGTH=301 /DNA_ID=CAMNT_0049346465 /DNA_START=29 /DNA_END=934 /DNA_ORIENTATION=-
MACSLLFTFLIIVVRGSALPGVDSDYGCNYMNAGGIGVPIDYCMRLEYRGIEVGVKWVCNETWTGVDMLVYAASDCSRRQIMKEPFGRDVSPGFYCNPEYTDKNCAEVSLNAYQDQSCTGDFFEIRLIAGECFLYEPGKYWKIECTPSTATMYEYATADGNCSDEYLVNVTRLTEGELGDEDDGCLLIEGCDEHGDFATNKNKTSLIIGYVVMAIILLILVLLAVIFISRYLQNKRLNEIEANMSSVQAVAVAEAPIDSDKPAQKLPYAMMEDKRKKRNEMADNLLSSEAPAASNIAAVDN